MPRTKPIQNVILDCDYIVAKYKHIQEKFPNCTVHDPRSYQNIHTSYSSNLVNAQYTNFDFTRGWNTLYVEPYIEIPFEYNGTQELIKINSSPRRKKLAHFTYRRSSVSNKRIMRFFRLKLNLKNNNFKEDMFNHCRSEILKFIRDCPNCELDTTHLDPSLKKLIALN